MGVGSGGSNVGKEGAAENLGRVGLAYAVESALELDVLPIELVHSASLSDKIVKRTE